MPAWVWGVVVLVVVLAVLGGAVAVARSRRRRVRIELRPLPEEVIDGYQSRADDLERLFVAQPREATAAAKLLVDDMLVRMGYPVRLTDAERVRDLRRQDAPSAERYSVGAGIKGDASTEQMRRALQAYLAMARDIAGRRGGQIA